MQIFTALRLANCPGRDQEAFPPICDCDLEIRSRSKILFSNGSPGHNIWVCKILPRYAENSASEVDPRLVKKTENRTISTYEANYVGFMNNIYESGGFNSMAG